MGVVVGLDVPEVRARVRAGFDVDRVAQIAMAAEAAIVEAALKREGANGSSG